MWVVLVGIYGIIKGISEIIRKKSLQISNEIEVLFFYTLIAFIMIIPNVMEAINIEYKYLALIFAKSFIVFIGWTCGYKALKCMPVGLYSILLTSQIIFTTLAGVLFLEEQFLINTGFGLALVIIGIILVNSQKFKDNSFDNKVKPRAIILVLINSLCSTCAEISDKVLTASISCTQLQFWFVLGLCLFYTLYVIVTRTKISIKTLKKNYWLWVSAILFVVGDRALFNACADENSTITAITLIKRCSVLIAIWGGKLVFGEKNVIYKTLCAVTIIVGIMIAI